MFDAVSGVADEYGMIGKPGRIKREPVTQTYHSRTGLTAYVQTGVPARGILPLVESAPDTTREETSPLTARRMSCAH